MDRTQAVTLGIKAQDRAGDAGEVLEGIVQVIGEDLRIGGLGLRHRLPDHAEGVGAIALTSLLRPSLFGGGAELSFAQFETGGDVPVPEGLKAIEALEEAIRRAQAARLRLVMAGLLDDAGFDLGEARDHVVPRLAPAVLDERLDVLGELGSRPRRLLVAEDRLLTAHPDAIEIAGKNKKIKPQKKQITESKSKPQSAPEPEENQVAFGEGGPVSGPYGTFSAGGAKGGFGFTGGGGDFGSRYAWYVDVVRRKVSENWLKYEVDPNIHEGRRVYITFQISRNGQPKSITISQSSGVPSLDQSAVRALQRIDTFGLLPGDYRGSSVNVEFWFDYRR